MKRYLGVITPLLAILYGLIGTVYAADESTVYQFLSSPLLALAVIVVIVIISLIYRRVRK